jgi:hypothetical protein
MEISFVSIPAVRDAVVTQRELPQGGEAPAAPVEPTAEQKRAAVREQVERTVGFLAGAAAANPEIMRGCYTAANLVMMAGELYYAAEDLKWEAEMEGDDSPNPAAIKAAADIFAKAVLAVVEEELSEAGAVGRAFAAAQTRAGKKHSADTMAQLQEIIDHSQRGIDCARGMMDGGGDEGGDRAAPIDDRRRRDLDRLALAGAA